MTSAPFFGKVGEDQEQKHFVKPNTVLGFPWLHKGYVSIIPLRIPKLKGCYCNHYSKRMEGVKSSMRKKNIRFSWADGR
jgi:hypothetical protein